MMPEGLLWQARNLCSHDVGRPREVNLRRAVSATYYAMFHFLIDQSCSLMMGTGRQRKYYRHVLARAFDHGRMGKVCGHFRGRSLVGGRFESLPGYSIGSGWPIHGEISSIAEVFVALKDRRHRSDYDLTSRHSRSEVKYLIEIAEDAILGFQQLPYDDDQRCFFLASLLAWSDR